MTVNEQGAETQPAEKSEETKNNGTQPNEVSVEKQPYKVFATEADFNKHSVGILNSAKNKAEKELLAMLGLKPDEKDKLVKFKEAYDNTLSEAERQAKSLDELNVKVESLRGQIVEKDAVILALSKITGKNTGDVAKFVRMAKGLVNEETDFEAALNEVFNMMKVEERKVPTGKPLVEPDVKGNVEKNPFKDGNLTEQGRLIKTDREKAREMYYAVHGKAPSW